MVVKWLNFRNLLKVETALSFFISVFFNASRVTGLAISEYSKETAASAGGFFFILGIIGAIGLAATRNKSFRKK